MAVKRYAIVTHARSRQEIEAYLPSNYTVAHEQESATFPGRLVFVIEGHDDAGWTLDRYVIPRLASGMILASEVDLSHPIMKEIPA